ncbi:MAG: L,D-transpeptidase [Patescibacteria group bacterium]|nr:L,D-transpeptidase [Patescibacteria group bacterium]
MYKPTPKGKRRIIRKVRNYVNRDGVPMPYAMFFTNSCAIHAWSWDEKFPDPVHGYASHGCISVSLRIAKWLYEEFTDKDTILYIWGERRRKCN